MDKFYRCYCILISLNLFITACGPWAVNAVAEEQPPRRMPVYEVLLGKSLNDKDVADFISNHNCFRSNQFQQCKDVGIALWMDSSQVVRTIYLYLNNADGFAPYKGELPFGLKFYDTMGSVEYKLKRQEVGNDGRPDSGATPDHMHFRAVYKQAGMTIIYNFPSADEDATIYAFLISK